MLDNTQKPSNFFACMAERALMRGLLPIAILASVAAMWFAPRIGMKVELALTICHTALIALAWGLERWRPHDAAWNRSQSDGWTDGLSFVTLASVVQPLLKWLSPLIVAALYAAWGFQGAQTLWQAHLGAWPWAVQFLMVLLWIELSHYAMHRLHHRLPQLFWLHAVHHSSQRLYLMNGFRVHPLEYMLKHFAAMLPLMLLGVSPELLLAYLAFTQPVQILQHANLPLRHGWLNTVFSTNELHRAHHSTSREQGDSNFGSALIVWDLLFGTYRGVSQAEPKGIGLYPGSSYPAQASFAKQLLSMFKPSCCAQGGRA